jgi:hypothetical protein
MSRFLKSFASKRIVDILPCSLIVLIIVIVPTLHSLVEDGYLQTLWVLKTPLWLVEIHHSFGLKLQHAG